MRPSWSGDPGVLLAALAALAGACSARPLHDENANGGGGGIGLSGAGGTPGSWADPAVRITDWVSGFGPNGVFLSACDASFAPSLDRLAQLLGQAP